MCAVCSINPFVCISTSFCHLFYMHNGCICVNLCCSLCAAADLAAVIDENGDCAVGTELSPISLLCKHFPFLLPQQVSAGVQHMDQIGRFQAGWEWCK